ALSCMQPFGTEAQPERMAVRTNQVRDWLIKTPAEDTEARVFRLLSLNAAAASTGDIAAAAKELLSKQRADGGWAQLDSGEPPTAIESDAYATGSALVALHQAGDLPTADPA